MHTLTWWAPTSVLQDNGLLDGLLDRFHWFAARYSQPPVVTTITAAAGVPEELSKRPTTRSRRRTVRDFRYLPWPQVLPSTPLRLAESGQIDLPISMLLQDSTTAPVATPTPSNVRHREESETAWVVEASVDGWSSIRHPRAAQGALSGPGVSDWLTRSTRRGVAWQSSPAFRQTGGPLAASIVRPRLTARPLIHQISAVLAEQSWTVAQSDKGAFAQRSTELFGGHRELALALREAPLQRLLFAFMAGKAEPDVPGKWLSADSRRVLTLADLTTVLDNPADHSAVDDLVDAWRTSETLQIGAVLKCERCRQASWYDIEAFGRTFTCARCRLNQDTDPGAWQAREPQWSYRLDEALLQFVLQRGDLSLLAVDEFLSQSATAAATTFEIEIQRIGEQTSSELDIAALMDGELLVGEATHSPTLKTTKADETARLTRLSDIANALGARHVLLANASEWHPRVEKAARYHFPGPWPQLHIREHCAFVARPTKTVA